MIIRTGAVGEGYQKIDYIQGAGASSITIPDNLNCDYFEFSAQYTDTSSEMCIVGNYYGGGTYRWEIFCSSGRKFYSIWSGYNSQGTTQGTVSATTKATVSYDYSTQRMNVNDIDSLSKVLGSQPKYLFQYGNNGLYAKAKMYYFLEKKNGKVVMNLVPVKRISDSKIGMYDTISNTFYPSATATDFTGGDEIKPKLKVSILPNEYQEVEYIQSAGGQGIVLDYKPISTDKIESTFAMTRKDVTSCLWCARGATTGTNTMTSFCIANSGIRGDFYNQTSQYVVNNAGVTVGQKYVLLEDGNKWYLDGVLKLTSTNATFTAGGKIRLFSSYVNGETSGVGNYAYLKLYKFRVLDKDNNLKLHLIPVIRKSDSVSGLYDLVNKNFYVNIGSGTFTSGSPINVYGKLVPRKCLYPGFDLVNYTKVEYLANSNGAQFLEIPFIPNASKGFRFEFGFNPTATGKRYALMSNYNIGSYQVSLEINASNKLRLWANTGSLDKASSNAFTVNDFNEGIFEFKNNKYYITLNGTVTSGDYTFSGVSTSTTMYAFLDKLKRTSTFPTPIKLYYIRIYEQDELKFNLIPCKRKSDDVYGMYDIVNKVFYYNLGTGSFTIGNEQKVII